MATQVRTMDSISLETVENISSAFDRRPAIKLSPFAFRDVIEKRSISPFAPGEEIQEFIRNENNKYDMPVETTK